MHGWISSDDTTVINHNGDYSSDVIITRYPEGGGDPIGRIEVPFEDLKNFVLEYFRDRKISQLEQVGYPELEGMFFE